MKISDYDATHVGEILSGHGDWFGAQLLRLIAKADQRNRESIRVAFPDYVAAYEAWFATDHDAHWDDRGLIRLEEDNETAK